MKEGQLSQMKEKKVSERGTVITKWKKKYRMLRNFLKSFDKRLIGSCETPIALMK